MNQAKPKLGVSACVLGERVRFNGGHASNRFVVDQLGRHVSWVAICPEVGIGMGVPRETVRLVAHPKGSRMIGGKSGADYTDQMKTFAQKKVDQFRMMGLHGFVLKKKSPSCGMERVPIYRQEDGARLSQGRGLFAQVLMEAFPFLPVEEDGRLHDAKLRENFLTRVFAFKRWCDYRNSSPTASGLVAFHSDHKMLLLAHSEQKYRELGQLVATSGLGDLERVLVCYGQAFMETLAMPASRKSHANVMFHLMGWLKRVLTSDEKVELREQITEYHQGSAPLSIPLTLIRHYFRKHRHPWIDRQVYFQPYPKSFGVRHLMMGS